MPAKQRTIARRLGQALLWLALLLILAAVAVWLWARPPTPDAFYDPPSEIPAEPGSLIRAEPFTTALPPGTRAWRILYTTTRHDGSPGIASAMVHVPTAGESPRPVIAWAHGTTGIAPGCAPSRAADPLQLVPALEPALARGWAVVSTDYPGLGTNGGSLGHAYLVGRDSAHAVLDSVRAARQLADAQIGGQTVVWGHSQGGHSALWTGIAAANYAPDVPLAGVAAFAPASDLPALMEGSREGVFGKIIGAMAARAYSRNFAELDFFDMVVPGARLVAADIASRCIIGRPTLVSVLQTRLLPATGLVPDFPVDGPVHARLSENSPNLPIAAPVLVAQGQSDDLVLPAVQSAWIKARCAAGQPLLYRTYADRDHVSLVTPESPLGPDLIAWTAERLAGRDGPSSCEPGG